MSPVICPVPLSSRLPFRNRVIRRSVGLLQLALMITVWFPPFKKVALMAFSLPLFSNVYSLTACQSVLKETPLLQTRSFVPSQVHLRVIIIIFFFQEMIVICFTEKQTAFSSPLLRPTVVGVVACVCSVCWSIGTWFVCSYWPRQAWVLRKTPFNGTETWLRLYYK